MAPASAPGTFISGTVISGATLALCWDPAVNAPLPPQLGGTTPEGDSQDGDSQGSRARQSHPPEAAHPSGAGHLLVGQRPLHPLPKGLVELYGLLAVLVVLVPEWMASGALLGFWQSRVSAPLPSPTRAWRELPELRLAAMSLAELRLQARQLRLRGYAGLGRDRLSARLLRRSKRRKALW